MNTPSGPLHIEEIDEGSIVILRIDDPTTRNALSPELGIQVRTQVQVLREHPGLRAVVLTGQGQTFSSGGSLSWLAGVAERAAAGDDVASTMLDFYRSFLAIRQLPVPVVAAVNGPAIGAGAAIAAACDIRIVADDAKINFNFTHLGLHPGMGASYYVPRIVGPGRAVELLAGGATVTGATAVAMGLASSHVPAETVVEAAVDLCRDFQRKQPEALTEMMSTLRQDPGLDEALHREATLQNVGFARIGIAGSLRRRT